MNLGASLNNHPYLDYFIADDEEGLKMQLKQITQPYMIMAMYAKGTKAVAWVSLTSPINKVVVPDGQEPPVKIKRKRGRPRKARKE